MNHRLSTILLGSCLSLAGTAWGAPVVVTDIPAVHSLVATVMGDTGTPELLLQGNASPHDYSIRPSQGRLLQGADLLIWTSEGLTPWLPRTVNAMAPDLPSIELLNDEGSEKLPARENNDFSHDDHDHDHAHAHTDGDPHGWLSTDNARHWLELIADRLAEVDPEQADIYQHNAEQAMQSLIALDVEVESQLAEVRGKPFVVFHDSYHYFEDQNEFHATASISLSDGTAPGVRQVNNLRKQVGQHPGICVFSEPQFSQRMINTIAENHDVRLGQLDPLGSTLEPGPALYETLIRNLASSLHECLSKDA